MGGVLSCLEVSVENLSPPQKVMGKVLLQVQILFALHQINIHHIRSRMYLSIFPLPLLVSRKELLLHSNAQRNAHNLDTLIMGRGKLKRIWQMGDPDFKFKSKWLKEVD